MNKLKELGDKAAAKIEKEGKFLRKKLKIKEKEEEKEKEKEEIKPETKVCPYCLSEIKYEATRCPYCTSTLEENDKSVDINKNK